MPGSSWLIYGLALGVLSLLMWQFTGDLRITLAMLFGGAVAALLLGCLAWLLLRAVAGRLRDAGLAWRLGSGELFRLVLRTVFGACTDQQSCASSM